MRRALFLILLFNSFFLCAQDGQEKKDSLIKLISADWARLIEIDSVSYRKVEGSAVFFHNDTYLYCDTAIWNMKDEYIDALYNVHISQEGTNLYGDSLHYIINKDLAQFRGSVVILEDKDGNVLRTRYLDYNTKDSVAYFMFGGSMKDKDGNIIESSNGTYDAKTSIFVFNDKVQMFSDSLFFVTDRLVYNSDDNIAYFYNNTQGWKDENYLRSRDGWYKRDDEILNFTRDVYMLTEEQQAWAQDLTYERNTGNAYLLDNIQILDTIQQTIVRCNELEYKEESSYTRLMQDPALIMLNEGEDGKKDTVFVSADTFVLFTKKRCDIDSLEIVGAEQRLELVDLDPIGAMREQIKQERLKIEQEDKLRQMGLLNNSDKEIGETDPQKKTEGDTTIVETPDIEEIIEPLPERDTTEVAFAHLFHDVKIFMEGMQVRCDSLVYTGIDSIARLYTKPILWNEETNQLTSDSMRFVIKNQVLTKGFLLSNAMVISEDTENIFHQIRGAEMIGYFIDNDLYRFDVLGGASSIYFIPEEEVFTTINTKNSKMMTAQIKERTIERMTYFQEIKNDAFPLEDVKEEEKRFRDFSWRPDERPVTRYDVTEWNIYPSERSSKYRDDFPEFSNTKLYFPGYVEDILKQIAERDSINRVNEINKARMQREAEDTMKFFADNPEGDSLLIEKNPPIFVEDLHEQGQDIALAHEHPEGVTIEEIMHLSDHYKEHIMEIDSTDKRGLSRAEKRELKQNKKMYKKEIKRLKREMKKINKEIKIAEKRIKRE